MPAITAFTCVKDAAWSIEAWYENVREDADVIIIQDGGSTDGTRELIVKWANEDPKVTAILQKEPTAKFEWDEADVRNRFLGMFKTGWVLLMDADELIEDGFWEWFRTADHRQNVGYYIGHRNLWLQRDMFRMDGRWGADLTLRLFRPGYFHWVGAEHGSLWRNSSPPMPSSPDVADTPACPHSFVHYHRAEPGYGPAVHEDRIPHHSNEKENLRHLVDPYAPRPVLARLRQHPKGAGKIKKRFE